MGVCTGFFLGLGLFFLSFDLSSGVFGEDGVVGPLAWDLILLRLLMVSVLREIGRGRPWSLRKRPHALQRTCPVSSRRQSGVVCVLQLRHTGDVIFVLVVVIPFEIWVVVLAFGWNDDLDAADTFAELVDDVDVLEFVEELDDNKLELLAGIELASPLGPLFIPEATLPTPPATLGALEANDCTGRRC